MTVEAIDACEVYVLDRVQFKIELSNVNKDFIQRRKKCLDSLDIMDPLKDDEKMELAQAMTESVFENNEMIFEQGQKMKHFYVLTDGQISFSVDGQETSNLTGTSDHPVYFAGEALMTVKPHEASAKVVSPTA